METKVCNKCKKQKPIDDFALRTDTGKRRNTCTDCRKLFHKDYYRKNKDKLFDYYKEHYLKNRDKILEYHKEYELKNKEIIKEKKKKYYEDKRDYFLEKSKKYREEHLEQVRLSKQTPKYKEWKKGYRIRYRREHPEKIEEATRNFLERRRNDPIFRLKHQTRMLIKDSFKRRNSTKSEKAEEILGCSIDYFISYLLNTYRERYGYEWDGKEKVHIDHITPLSIAKTREDVYKMCHYSNLQLLKARDNLEKSNRLNWDSRDTKNK